MKKSPSVIFPFCFVQVMIVLLGVSCMMKLVFSFVWKDVVFNQ